MLYSGQRGRATAYLQRIYGRGVGAELIAYGGQQAVLGLHRLRRQ